VRSSRQTLGALTGVLAGEGIPSAEQIEAVLRLRWKTAAPATWNRHVATIRSLLAYSERHRLLPTIDVRSERRREPEDRTRALPSAAELEWIWALRGLPVVTEQERTLSQPTKLA